jgi:hypothetical protein
MRRLTVTAFLFLLLSAPRAVWALPALSDAELAGQTMIVFFRGAELDETRLLLLFLGTPYDIALLPRAATAVAAYGDDGFTLEALARLLGGEISPQGRLPVDIPGHLPRGWGLLRFP